MIVQQLADIAVANNPQGQYAALKQPYIHPMCLYLSQQLADVYLEVVLGDHHHGFLDQHGRCSMV